MIKGARTDWWLRIKEQGPGACSPAWCPLPFGGGFLSVPSGNGQGRGGPRLIGEEKEKVLIVRGGSPGAQSGRANQLCTCSGPSTPPGGGLGCSGPRALELQAPGQKQPRHLPRSLRGPCRRVLPASPFMPLRELGPRTLGGRAEVPAHSFTQQWLVAPLLHGRHGARR